MRYESNRDLMKFLRENTILIMNTFKKSGTRNLRILKHALNDFNKIYEMVSKFYPNTNNLIMKTMLIFTIAMSFEIKAGKITKEKFKTIKNNEEYKSILVSSRVLMDNRQFYIKEFDSNYYYNFKAEYRFFKFIEYYIRTRIFDMKIFKADMEEVEKSLNSKKISAYKQILTQEYWKIQDDAFFGIVNEALEDVKKGDMELIDMVKLFAYYIHFIKKDLISYDLKNLKSIFLNGMNLASLHSTYCDNVDEELSKIAIKEFYTTDMEEILNHFKELNEQLLEKSYKEKAEDTFKNIPMKMESFYAKFDKECMDIPILAHYDPYQVFQRISCATNEDIMIIKDRLVKRFELHPKELESEIKNLKILKQTLDDYLKGKEITIKIVVLQEFSSALMSILEKVM